MRLSEMSQTRLRSWLAAVIWTLAGVGFFLTFFSGGGPEGLASDSMRHVAGAGAVAFGFLGYWLALWLTRQRQGRPPAVDERDLQVSARANQATLVVVLMVIFTSPSACGRSMSPVARCLWVGCGSWPTGA